MRLVRLLCTTAGSLNAIFRSKLSYPSVSQQGLHFTMSRKTRGRMMQDSSQKRLKVLVDMDQVLCDFEGTFLKRYREKYPDEPFIQLKDRNTFYVVEQYLKEREDLQYKAREIITAQGFFLNMPPLEGACAAMAELSQMDGVDTFICSSPIPCYEYCLQEKFQWVDNHLGPEWVQKILLTRDKTMVYGDVLIDDKPRITGACDPPSWRQVLFTAPYNLNNDLRGRYRLDNWTDGRWKDIIEDFKKRI